MTTQSRRNQNAATVELPDDIEQVLERQLKQEKSRKEYNERPEVKAKRAEYQKKQQRMRAISRAADKGDVNKLIEEFGFTEAQARDLVAKAKAISAKL